MILGAPNRKSSADTLREVRAYLSRYRNKYGSCIILARSERDLVYSLKRFRGCKKKLFISNGKGLTGTREMRLVVHYSRENIMRQIGVHKKEIVRLEAMLED